MISPAPPLIKNELLITSVTPQNLERDDLWFEENREIIKKARITNPWWRENSVIIEKDLVLRPLEFTRRLAELGYERAQSIRGKGLFTLRGGLLDIWPINTSKPFTIEFSGNAIASIRERHELEELVKPQIRLARGIEGLPLGSFVVHEDHGIGIFRGATAKDKFSIINSQFSNKSEKITRNSDPFVENWKLPARRSIGAGGEIGNSTKNSEEFFVVEYAPPAQGREPDRLFVPLDQKKRLTPYVGFEMPRIHRLGGTVWHTTKRKVKEDAEKLARELLSLYASRSEAARPRYEGDPIIEEELRATFPFQETRDQLRAEKEILEDLGENRPMDRILCGDVGFGKTEIALRAALRVISSGKQVALLSPTTVLAAQHFTTFHERFAHLAVHVRMMSRLLSSQEEKEALRELSEGKVDIIIGTHRLLSKDITFRNLGLVIIDEEQRFGVKQKERLKSLRTEVDVLALSATPIPRTMQFVLAKLRDVSLLETPPPERLPIQTFVLPYSPKLIREAIRAELDRGGQVYFLHNRIETIGKVKERLEKLVRVTTLYDRKKPSTITRAKNPTIAIIHGRMGEKELVRTMDAFRKKEIDILVATTIIENGLDISSANTLIVDDATRLGLAQAHQLRGRIGRGNVEAFAYFLYRAKNLTEKAEERLRALQEYTELGAGYQLALRDLEIRGAGNILGREQSGAVNKVGLNLYYQMLGEAIEEMKSGSSKGGLV